MDRAKRYKQLLEKRKMAREKLERALHALDHPHGQWQSAHDLAESDLKVWTAYLEDIEKELKELGANEG